MEIIKEIINKLEEEKISTEEVSDILGKTGCVKGVYPVNEWLYSVGEIQYVYAHSNSNWALHEQLRSLVPDKVLFVDGIGVDSSHAIFGELVSSYIIENCKARAIIVNGYMRDLIGLKRRGYPIWCQGITPIGCLNINVPEYPETTMVAKQNKQYYEGSIAVCDSSGVVVIPKEEIETSFLTKIDNMVEQERIWFDCVERRGWNTYDTVCLKKYREEKD